MADLTKAEVAELTADHVLIKGLTLKIAADTEAIKAAAKRIDAKLKKAAKNFADGKTERTRFG
ncbi:MAG: hypothetical protein KDA71_05385, partial [Planctomycetales bacterium]|nr:hypothetical protein [Planctomycetales bacterium]